MKRLRDHGVYIGCFPVGPLNRISDVKGFKVGHYTIDETQPSRVLTGVTVIEVEEVFEKPPYAASHVLNGFGKPLGLVQIEELGIVETPIALTNTLSAGAVHEGIVRHILNKHPEVNTVNPVVFECNDSRLNDISSLAIKPEDVMSALNNAGRDFELGSIGAGAGMVSFGFKSGIGSASRIVDEKDLSFTIGALVLSNYGRRSDFFRDPLEDRIPDANAEQLGSIVIIVAVDLPLVPHQLKRIARHAAFVLGEIGTPGYYGSGDFILTLSTLRAERENSNVVSGFLEPSPAAISAMFRGVNDAVLEAILDSMVCSEGVSGYKTTAEALPLDLLLSKTKRGGARPPR